MSCQCRRFHHIKHFFIQGRGNGEGKLIRFQKFASGRVKPAEYGALHAPLLVHQGPADNARACGTERRDNGVMAARRIPGQHMQAGQHFGSGEKCYA